MSDLNQNHQERSQIPSTSDDDDENSFVILSTCINGDYDEERLDTLPPIESLTLKDIQSLVNGELSKINAQAQRQKDANRQELGSPMTSLKSIDNHMDIQKKIEELICENEKLKSALQQNNLSMKAQKEKITLWQKEIEKFCQAHKDKLTEAKESIDKLKETNLKLSEEVVKYKDIKILQDEEILALKSQLKDKSSNDNPIDSEDTLEEFELDMANQKMQEQEVLIKQLQEKNNLLIEINEKLNAKATKYDSLEDYRQLEQKKYNELRVEMLEKMKMIELNEKKWQDEINELKMENERLRKQHSNNDDSLQKELNELKSKYDPNLTEKHEQLRLQLMNAQKTITDLEEELLKSKQQIDKLTTKLNSDGKINDEIFVLRQQLDIYKSDFDAERQAKSLLKDENRQMSEDLKNLQRRNEQLQEQVETLRLSSLSSSSSSTTTTNTSTTATTTGLPPGGYSCPQCNFGFKNYQSLENHVIRCLQLDD